MRAREHTIIICYYKLTLTTLSTCFTFHTTFCSRFTFNTCFALYTTFCRCFAFWDAKIENCEKMELMDWFCWLMMADRFFVLLWCQETLDGPRSFLVSLVEGTQGCRRWPSCHNNKTNTPKTHTIRSHLYLLPSQQLLFLGRTGKSNQSDTPTS